MILTCRIFDAPLWVQSHTVLHWKALRYGKDDSTGLSCGSTLNIHQEVLESGNLLHKRGFVDSQFGTTVCIHACTDGQTDVKVEIVI